MLAENQPSWDPWNQCGADHKSGTTPVASSDYANQAVLFPDQLSLGDDLILHALGVTWSVDSIRQKRRRTGRSAGETTTALVR